MSEPAAETEKEAVVLPDYGDAAFGTLMDALAPEPEDGKPGAPAAEAGTTPVGAGDAAAPAGGTAAPAAGGAPAAGEAAPAGDGQPAGDKQPAGEQPAGGAEGAPAGNAEQPAAVLEQGDRPADWTASVADVRPQLEQLTTAIEENTTRAFQNAAYEAVKTEHAAYFDLLDQHPRLLAGQQVPAIGKEGVEVLRDANDAREWQDAVKSILVAEIRSRASKEIDENKDYLNTLHASVELFTKNPDLVPETKEFDTELANRFATLAQPYELRVEGKLQGYSIPVQPIIDSIRTALTAERAAKTPPPATAAPAATPSPGAGGGTDSKDEQPQAGIQTKAGSSAEVEDFSTLFGTLGLPGLKI